MWPFRRKPQVLIITKVKDSPDSYSYSKIYHFKCLVCGAEFERTGNLECVLRVGDPSCLQCGARRSMKEIHENMRREKELDLRIEQEKKRVEKLRELAKLREETKMLEQGTKRNPLPLRSSRDHRL